MNAFLKNFRGIALLLVFAAATGLVVYHGSSLRLQGDLPDTPMGFPCEDHIDCEFLDNFDCKLATEPYSIGRCRNGFCVQEPLNSCVCETTGGYPDCEFWDDNNDDILDDNEFGHLRYRGWGEVCGAAENIICKWGDAASSTMCDFPEYSTCAPCSILAGMTAAEAQANMPELLAECICTGVCDDNPDCTCNAQLCDVPNPPAACNTECTSPEELGCWEENEDGEEVVRGVYMDDFSCSPPVDPDGTDRDWTCIQPRPVGEYSGGDGGTIAGGISGDDGGANAGGISGDGGGGGNSSGNSSASSQSSDNNGGGGGGNSSSRPGGSSSRVTSSVTGNNSSVAQSSTPVSGPGPGPGPGANGCTSDEECGSRSCLGPLLTQYCFTNADGVQECIDAGACIQEVIACEITQFPCNAGQNCNVGQCVDRGIVEKCECAGPGPGPGPGPGEPGPPRPGPGPGPGGPGPGPDNVICCFQNNPDNCDIAPREICERYDIPIYNTVQECREQCGSGSPGPGPGPGTRSSSRRSRFSVRSSSGGSSGSDDSTGFSSTRSSDGDTDETHLECRGDACVEVNGAGNNECDRVLGCSETNRAVCRDNSCLISNESGPNECSGSIDCNQHTECRDLQCFVIDGPGDNECLSEEDCLAISSRSSATSRNTSSRHTSSGGNSSTRSSLPGPGPGPGPGPEERHLECRGDACVEVDGAGNNECDRVLGCAVQRAICHNSMCLQSNESGPNECSTSVNCNQHTECIDLQCIVVDGEGENECTDFSDCEEGSSSSAFSSAHSQITSAASSNVSSTVFSSAVFSSTVFSSAASSTSLPPFHAACIASQCTLVFGPGDDECNPLNPDFCVPPVASSARSNGSTQSQSVSSLPGYHLACINNACQVVAGEGEDTCSPFIANACGGPDTETSSRSSSRLSIMIAQASSSSSERELCDVDNDCPDGNQCIDGECFSQLERLQDCGNNLRNPGEECDDGNRANGDGCDFECLLEPLTPLDRLKNCGNGLRNSGEECDDGNRSNGDGCNSKCAIENYVAAAAICGNGVLENNEECDDGNRRDNDGCNSTCLLEIGICGDGIVQTLLGEQCESSTHDPSLPYTCVRCHFVSQTCGDGNVDRGEECDEGSQNSMQPDAHCRPNCQVSHCGDTVIDANELCDDGNRLNGDGCDRYCRTEIEEDLQSSIASEATEIQPETLGARVSFGNNPLQPYNNNAFQFPQYPNYQKLPYQLPLAQLQPVIQSQGPMGDTGPAAVAVAASGMAAGIGWMRRKKR